MAWVRLTFVPPPTTQKEVCVWDCWNTHRVPAAHHHSSPQRPTTTLLSTRLLRSNQPCPGHHHHKALQLPQCGARL
jgi:hypothetical protein